MAVTFYRTPRTDEIYLNIVNEEITTWDVNIKLQAFTLTVTSFSRT